eukprot:27707_1
MDKFKTLKVAELRRWKVGRNDTVYNMVAMDHSGKFNIPMQQMDQLFDVLVRERAAGNKDMALVPFSRSSKNKTYLDIDKTEGLANEIVINCATQIVMKYFDSRLCYVLKNPSFDKYHVIFPHIVQTKINILKITKEINHRLQEYAKHSIFPLVNRGVQDMAVDDNVHYCDIGVYKPTGTTLRIEGFRKFNNNTNQFMVDTDYEIIYPKHSQMDLQFYRDTLLLCSEDTPITPFRTENTLFSSPANNNNTNHHNRSGLSDPFQRSIRSGRRRRNNVFLVFASYKPCM